VSNLITKPSIFSRRRILFSSPICLSLGSDGQPLVGHLNRLSTISTNPALSSIDLLSFQTLNVFPHSRPSCSIVLPQVLKKWSGPIVPSSLICL